MRLKKVPTRTAPNVSSSVGDRVYPERVRSWSGAGRDGINMVGLEAISQVASAL